MKAGSADSSAQATSVVEWALASFDKKECLEWTNPHLWKINQEYGGLVRKSFAELTNKKSDLVWIHYPLARVPQLWIWLGSGKFPWEKLPIPKGRVALFLDSSIQAKEVPVQAFESVIVNEWSSCHGLGVRWVEPQL